MKYKNDLERVLYLFREIYFGEEGLGRDILAGRLTGPRVQFENVASYIQTCTEVVRDWVVVSAQNPCELRALFGVIAKTLETGAQPRSETLSRFEKLSNEATPAEVAP